jgi:hypothetical protein
MLKTDHEQWAHDDPAVTRRTARSWRDLGAILPTSLERDVFHPLP